MTENVNHPAHYGGEDNPYEVIKVAEAWKFDQDAYLFNALKYIARPAKGNHLEDLKKAVWYLNRKIGRLEEERLVLENLDGPEAEPSTSTMPVYPEVVAAIVEAEAEIASGRPLTTLDTVIEWSNGHREIVPEDTWPEDAQLTVKHGFRVWTEYATGTETVGEFADLAAAAISSRSHTRFLRLYTLKFADMDRLPRNAKLKDVAVPGDVLFLVEA